MRKSAIAALSLTAAVGLAAATATPAVAGSPTTTTFQIGGGSLSISAPASASLGTVTSGATLVSGSLGNVTVTDDRGLLAGTWTATVTSTDFSNGTTDIPAASILYTAGPATPSSGLTLGAPGAGPLSNSTPLVAQSAVTLLGNNSATWDPTIAVTIPANATAGTYTATITHSVA